jgi:predicted nucleic acid-binding Zn ribbon protein
MKEILAPKKVECACGNSVEIVVPKIWCENCCQPLFYREKDQRRERINRYYMIGVFAFAIMLITFFFIEIVAAPLLG